MVGGRGGGEFGKEEEWKWRGGSEPWRMTCRPLQTSWVVVDRISQWWRRRSMKPGRTLDVKYLKWSTVPHTWTSIEKDTWVACSSLTCAQGGCQNPREERTQLDLILENGSGVVSDEINTRNLLKHLVNIGQAGSVKMAIFIARKQVQHSCFSRFKHSLLNCAKFAENVRVVRRSSAESAEDFKGFIFVSL